MSMMIFDTGMLPVIRELLPVGVEAIDDPILGPVECEINIDGDAVPEESEYCRMRVWLALDGDIPVRTVMFEAVLA